MDSNNAVANGSSYNHALVTVRDGMGKPMNDQWVIFDNIPGYTFEMSNSWGVRGCLSNANGHCSAFLRTTTAGQRTVRARLRRDIGETPITAEPTSTFVAGPVSLAQMTLEMSPATGQAPADGATPLTFTMHAKDAFGNAVTLPSSTAPFLLKRNNGGWQNLAECRFNNSSTCTATLTSAVAESYRIVPTNNAGNEIGSGGNQRKTVEFVAGAPTSANSTVEVTGGTQPADGTASHTITVRLLDAHDNPASFSAGANVYPRPLPAGVTAPTIVCAAGATTCTGTVRSTVAGTHAIPVRWTNSDTGTPLKNSPVRPIFVAGVSDPSQSSMKVTVNGNPAGGAAANRVLATLTDAFGNPVAGRSVRAWMHNDNAETRWNPVHPQLSHHGLCDTNDEGQCEFEVTTTQLAGKKGDIRASIDGSTTPWFAQTPEMIFVGSPNPGKSSLAMATNGKPVSDGSNASQHNTVTATVKDVNENPVNGATVVFDALANVTFHGTPTANQCTTTADGTCTVALSSTHVGPHTLTAKINGVAITGGNAQANFVPGGWRAGQSTMIVTPEGPVAADGTANYTITMTARDQYGNPTPLGSSSVFFVRKVDGLVFDPAVPNHATRGGECRFGAGGTTTTTCQLRVASTRAGAYELVPADGANNELGLELGGQRKTVEFIAGAAVPGNSTLTVSSGDKVANGTDKHTATVTTKDANNNLVGGVLVTFPTVNDLNFSAGTCTTGSSGADLGVCRVDVTTTLAASYNVSATMNGAAVDGSPKTVNFIAGPASPAHSVLDVTPGDQVANGTDKHTATVTAKDAHNNLVGGVTVNFPAIAGVDFSAASCVTETAPGATFGTCSTALTTIVAGRYEVSATMNGTVVGDSPKTVTFIAGPADPATSTLAMTTNDQVADGDKRNVATATIKDAGGNPIEGHKVRVRPVSGYTLYPPHGANGDALCTTGPEGQCSIEMTATAAGSKELVGHIGEWVDSPQFAAQPTSTFIAGPADATRSSVTIAGGKPVSDGSNAANRNVVTVTIRDALNNPVAGRKATVRDAPADYTFYGEGTGNRTCVSGVDGTCTIGMSTTVAGEETLRVLLGEFSADPDIGTVQSLFVAGDVSLAQMTLDMSPANGQAPADGATPITFTMHAKDAFGNAVTLPSSTAPFLLKRNNGGWQNLAECPFNNSSTCTATLTSAVAESYVVVPTNNAGNEIGSGSNQRKTVTFAADPDRDKTRLVADPAEVAAGESTTLRLTLKTSGDAPVSGKTVVFQITGIPSAPLPATETPSGSGVYAATLTHDAPGTATVRATYDGTDSGQTATVTFTEATDPVDPAKSRIAANPDRIAIGDVETSMVTVTLLDSNDKPVSGQDVDITTDAGRISSTAPGAGPGTYVATLTSGTATRNQQATLGFTLDGNEMTQTANVRFIERIAVDDPTRANIVSASAFVSANGRDSTTITVRLTYASDGAPAPGHTVTIETDLGILERQTDVGDGTYTAQLRSFDVGTGTLTFQVDGEAAVATTQVNFVPQRLEP